MNISYLFTFLSNTEGAYNLLCDPCLREFDISKTAFDIIMFLHNNPSQYTAKDISKMKNIKPNVVSMHVDKLCNIGYIERTAVPGDRRQVKLVLTDKAEPIITKGKEIQKEFLEKLWSGLSAKDLQVFHHCFETITKNAGDIIKDRK